MLTAKVIGHENRVEIGWSPDFLDIKEILKTHPEDNPMHAMIDIMLASALADTSAVITNLQKYLEGKLGKAFAELYKEMITSHPEMLFGDIPKDVQDELKKKAKEDIRNADFY